ncbi:MAG: CDP-diacylglycerol--glycerol-3-phosphate 3-phosphatidyltransferase [Clostridiales bacterium]|nr:CDP-diacylglycerol--glycerol-3-phosphate 3-phosphatidyltransferase [Clostridiales bacterium]
MKKMNIPNLLTMLRVILIPVIVLLTGLECFTAAGILFILASLTDFLDGYLARKYDLVTDFGKFLDPVADKLLVLTSMIMLCATRANLPVTFPAWLICIVIGRDLMIDGLRMIASSKGTVIAAGILGKIKTTLQIIAVISVIFGAWRWLSILLMAAMGLMTVLSGVDYFMRSRRIVFGGRSEESEAEQQM